METLHPGLYLQEVPGEQPIEGVSTSTGAFVGVAEKGPIGESGFVTSWQQFVELYGSYSNNSYLAYAVRGFFENGGTRAYISRAVHYDVGVKTSSPATIDLSVSTETYASIDAKYDGIYGNSIGVELANVDAEKGTFDFLVSEKGVQLEKYESVTLEDLEDIVNADSKLVKVTVVDETAVPTAIKEKLAGGNDGIDGITATDYVGDPALKTGLYAFDNDEIRLVAVPGITDVAVIAGLTSYVENRQDAFAIVESPMGKTPQTVLEFKQTEANIASERVGFYNTWIKVADPIGVGKNPTKLIPPSGHIAGIYARTDNARGVYKAPAGLEAVVRGAIGLEYNVSDAEQDILNPVGINAIRSFAGEGIILWGARTCSSSAEYKYIPVRRSVDYIEQSVLAGTRWSVFEPNDATLWGKLTSSVEAFLRGFWRAGGLRGTQEADAFYVQCDSTTTTPDDIDVGRVYAHIGVAPQKPAEFIIFKVSLRK
jgi:uncharacterized protein